MTSRAERQKLNVAADKGRQIGIRLQWMRDTVEVRGMDQIALAWEDFPAFLIDPIGRSPTGEDVCTLVAVGIFTTAPGANGSRPFGFGRPRTEELPVSGVVHRDRRPPSLFKYVLIHEIGHYFALEHEDGIDKIMFSPATNSWWRSWWIFEYAWWSGEPRFTLDNGKRTWDFLIDEIPGCLAAPRRRDVTVERALTPEERRIAERARVEE
jgi:hypothetical protein